MKMQSCVLGIETSCDETGIAIYEPERGIVADVLHSQTPVHQEYGGVVPELASRDHIRMTLPLIAHAMSVAGITKQHLRAIGYTAGPGLNGSLLVGAAIGRSIACALSLPAVAVHHMEAHLLAPMLEPEQPQYPFLALLVSGGHTLLVAVQAYRDYQVLGESVDDAVGEAFDKTAKLLGLPYPGGAPLSDLADSGDPERFHFPRPMTDRPGLDFSFSGLKTHALLTWRAHCDSESPQLRADIARAFVDAAVDVLAIKCERAIRETGLRQFIVAGGVSANRQLRTRLHALGEQHGVAFFFPRPQWCTDNGAMVAYAAWQQLQLDGETTLGFPVYPRWPLHRICRKPSASVQDLPS